jgi:hypothetical protein
LSYGIAFDVGLSTTVAVPPVGSVVKYDAVSHNGGQAYDVTTGLFTCPVDGLYLFLITHTNGIQSAKSEVQIRTDDSASSIARARPTQYAYGSAPGVGFVNCERGQTVWAEIASRDSNSLIRGAHYSKFSGALIYQKPNMDAQVRDHLILHKIFNRFMKLILG